MPVPKSTVKSLAASNSSNSTILNNHPHPNIHNYIHSKYRIHNHPGNTNAISEPQKHENNSTNSIKSNDIETIENKNPISWDLQDDLLLRYLKEVKSLGWKEIAKYFSNRTANACQFRWRRLKSGNLKNNHTISIDINSIDTTTLFKTIEHNLSSDLIDSQSKHNDADVLLPHLEIMTQNVNKYSTNKNNIKGKASKHNSNDTNVYSSYTNENTNVKLFVSNTSQFAHNSNNTNNDNHNNTNNNAMNTYNITHNNKSSNAMNLITTNETNMKGLRKSVSTVSMKSFAKPRSFSLNVTRPNLNILNNNNNNNNNNNHNTHSQKVLDISQPEDENVGFIPKIIIRSRRSSFNTINSNPTFVIHNSNLLGNDISRRNSVVIRSRRPSVSLSLNSAVSSRRSSFHMTNDYLDSHLTINNNPQFNSNRQGSIHGFAKWDQTEDQLLLDLINIKKLNIKEVSILLPNRSEEEIKWRFQHLAKEK